MQFSQEDMLQVVKILKQVGATNSRNEKEDILKGNKDNILLQKVFEYSYSPYKVYGFGKKSLEGVSQLGLDMIQSRFSDIFTLLDYLTTVNVNNQIKGEVIAYLATIPLPLRELYVNMLLKDLRIGVTETTINKIWKGLVPKFNVMLAHKYKDYVDKVVGKEFIITTKLDGIRAIIIKEDNNIRIMSRQNKPIEGCVEILEEAKKLPNNMVYDGEMLKINNENLPSDELFIETKKITGKKGIKKDLEFHCFDMLPIEEFKAGKSKLDCLSRKTELKSIIDNNSFNLIKEVPILYVGKDTNKINELLDEAIANHQEGVMINIANGKYECKRSREILKVKKMYTMDLKIIGFEEGNGKYKGMLGKIDVDYKGFSLGIGSGFTDEERIEIWNNKDKYLGRVVETQYFEESTDDKGNLSLRFPIFKGFREKGKEVSYS